MSFVSEARERLPAVAVLVFPWIAVVLGTVLMPFKECECVHSLCAFDATQRQIVGCSERGTDACHPAMDEDACAVLLRRDLAAGHTCCW